MKDKRRVILGSALAIAMSASVIAGSTLALFTSESSVNIGVTSAQVKVTATVDKGSLELHSMNQKMELKNEEGDALWKNGGTAGFTGDSKLELKNITPGDSASFNILVKNESTINIKYRVTYAIDGALKEALDCNITGAESDAWTNWSLANKEQDKTISVSVALPEDTKDEFQGLGASIAFQFEAVQGNAAVDGTLLPEGVTEQDFVKENAVAFAGDTFYPTLKAATLAGADEIFLAPDAELTETFTHVHVSGDLTVYGNGATLAGAGEHDFEVDTYNDKGAQTGEGVGLSADTTLNIYNLNRVAVWGQRTTGYTLNVNLYNCHDIERVYITGTTGINHITLNDCSASDLGSACKVYSNAAGSVTVKNCTFNTVQEPINLNNKSDGVQNVVVENCEFINCSTAEIITELEKDYAAPVRTVVSNRAGKSNVYLTNNTFTYTDGKTPYNGNLLLIEMRTTGDYFAFREGVDLYLEGQLVSAEQKVVLSTEDIKTLADGDSLLLGKGTFVLPASNGEKTINVTVTGVSKEESIVSSEKSVTLANATLNFSNLTLKGINENYIGFKHTAKLTFKDCKINEQIYLYANTVTFDKCEFTQNGNNYCVWTYGSKNVTFTDCTFHTAGKAVLIYNEDATLVQNVNFKACKFFASKDVGKGAVEMHTECLGTGHYTATLTNCTQEGFGPGLVVACNNNTGANTLGEFATVFIDGEEYFGN